MEKLGRIIFNIRGVAEKYVRRPVEAILVPILLIDTGRTRDLTHGLSFDFAGFSSTTRVPCYEIQKHVRGQVFVDLCGFYAFQ